MRCNGSALKYGWVLEWTEWAGRGRLAAQLIVIPEPATFGLMGVAALGLFLARKKARS